jgi:triphosphoribosyl-dephospho-CoA synthase
VSDGAARIAAAFTAACRAELEALKPGNVHVFADGHRMTAAQFIRSAEAAAAPLTQAGASVGRRILEAVEATAAAVGTNTNLGIILLCAPLAAAAETSGVDLRAALARALEALTVEDARLAFRAIVLASPGGLGDADQHDVRAPATVSLRDAMAAAADRDRIARQYVSAFQDVFAIGRTAHAAARAQSDDAAFATQSAYLAFLAAFPDTHIVRKHGPGVAAEVRRTASDFCARLWTAEAAAHLHADLMAWDRRLKARGINPGTSADLTVATLFVARLPERLAVGA